MIQGITVVLYEKTANGVDELGNEKWTETPVNVSDVLVSPATSEDVINELTLNGRKAVYQLGIPKGDTHRWDDSRVDFFGESFKTYGEPIKGIDENIPLKWNMKVWVERYEQI